MRLMIMITLIILYGIDSLEEFNINDYLNDFEDNHYLVDINNNDYFNDCDAADIPYVINEE